MPWENLKKLPKKINEFIVNLKGPFATTISNHTRRKAVLATTCILTVVVLGIIMENFSSGNRVVYASSVRGLGAGIYWDQACKNTSLSFEWGQIKAGSSTTLTVYVKNQGNSAVSLLMGTSNWTPSASSSFMSLSWNYSGQVLSANQVIPLKLTLTVYPNITGIANFNFNTIITTTTAR